MKNRQVKVSGNGLYILLGLSLLVNFILLNMVTTENAVAKETRLDNLEKMADEYLDREEFRVGPFDITQDMTVFELRELYRTYRSRPQSREFMYYYIQRVCDGQE